MFNVLRMFYGTVFHSCVVYHSIVFGSLQVSSINHDDYISYAPFLFIYSSSSSICKLVSFREFALVLKLFSVINDFINAHQIYIIAIGIDLFYIVVIFVAESNMYMY